MNKTLVQQVGDPEARRDSTLCLACGLCCRGVLHPDALLDPEELRHAAGCELKLSRKPDGQDVFALPCRCHDHPTNSCGIYDDRFHVCRRYACDLLVLLRCRDVSLDDALAIVRQTRELETAIYEEIGGYDPSRTIWERITAHVGHHPISESPTSVTHAALLLRARALSLLCHRHFEHRMHKRLNENSGIPSGKTRSAGGGTSRRDAPDAPRSGRRTVSKRKSAPE